MERVPQPDPEYDEHIRQIKEAFMEAMRNEGLPLDQLPEILRDDAVANRLSQRVQDELAAKGVDVDSLDLLAAYIEIEDGPWLGGGEGSGGLGVREPLSPLPNAGGDSIKLRPPRTPVQGPDYYERRTEIDLNRLPLSGVETESEDTEEPRALTIEERHAQQRELATKLGPYVGKWVMVRGAEVVASESTPDELLKNNQDIQADRMFLVLDGKKKLILGRQQAA